jgi:AcrR family transcriptional regulator
MLLTNRSVSNIIKAKWMIERYQMALSKQDKRILRGYETNHTMIKCAMDMIAESGVGSLSASKLAARAGISKSNIFHHFPSLKDIPEAVLHYIFNEMRQSTDLSEDKSLCESLCIIGESYFKMFFNSQKWLRCFFSFYHEGLFHKEYKDILTHYLNESKFHIAEVIKGQAKKKISDEKANLYASILVVTLDGMGMQMLLLEDCAAYLELWKEQVELICCALEEEYDRVHIKKDGV